MQITESKLRSIIMEEYGRASRDLKMEAEKARMKDSGKEVHVVAADGPGDQAVIDRDGDGPAKPEMVDEKDVEILKEDVDVLEAAHSALVGLISNIEKSDFTHNSNKQIALRALDIAMQTLGTDMLGDKFEDKM